MRNTNKRLVAFVLFGLPIACVAMAQTTSPKPQLWLLQSVHVVGDIREGFRKSCLVVSPNGEYHREERRQLSADGHAQFGWEAPEVFEARLTQTDLNALQSILETPEFSSIEGVVGDSGSLRHRLSFDPQGDVTPHEDIEIVTVAVARSNAPQLFELADIHVARQKEPVKAFLDWVKGTERRQVQRLSPPQASNCSPSPRIATGGSSVGGAQMATGMTFPKVIYAPQPTPKPQLPHDTPRPQPVAVELLINPDGSVAKALLESRSSPDVAQSVLDTVRKWKFQPARLLGVPIADTIHIRVEFRDK